MIGVKTYIKQKSYTSIRSSQSFFEKITGKGGTPPEFLSTHPDPGNRVKDIKAKAQSLGCKGNKTNKTEYEKIKKLLK